MFEVERKAEGGGGGWEGEGSAGAFKGWGARRCGGGILSGWWFASFVYVVVFMSVISL